MPLARLIPHGSSQLTAEARLVALDLIAAHRVGALALLTQYQLEVTAQPVDRRPEARRDVAAAQFDLDGCEDAHADGHAVEAVGTTDLALDVTMGAQQVGGVDSHEVGQLDAPEVEPGEILQGDFFVTIFVDAHDHCPSMPAAADGTTDSRSGERAWTRREAPLREAIGTAGARTCEYTEVVDGGAW